MGGTPPDQLVFNIHLFHITTFIFTCGSTSIQVTEGSLELTTSFNEKQITSQINAGNGIKLDVDANNNLLKIFLAKSDK